MKETQADECSAEGAGALTWWGMMSADPDMDLTRSESDLTRSWIDLTRSESDLTRSWSDLTRSESDLTRLAVGFSDPSPDPSA